MGSLDTSTGSRVKRKIAIQDVTQYTPSQIVTYFNNNLGDKGWRIVQILVIGNNRYIVAEKEV